jgi:hypothetical protein
MQYVPPFLSGPDPGDLLRDSPEDADKPAIEIRVPTDDDIARYLPPGQSFSATLQALLVTLRVVQPHECCFLHPAPCIPHLDMVKDSADVHAGVQGCQMHCCLGRSLQHSRQQQEGLSSNSSSYNHSSSNSLQVAVELAQLGRSSKGNHQQQQQQPLRVNKSRGARWVSSISRLLPTFHADAPSHPTVTTADSWLRPGTATEPGDTQHAEV